MSHWLTPNHIYILLKQTLLSNITKPFKVKFKNLVYILKIIRTPHRYHSFYERSKVRFLVKLNTLDLKKNYDPFMAFG